VAETTISTCVPSLSSFGKRSFFTVLADGPPAPRRDVFPEPFGP
jgi:hypothetical protein